MTKYSASHGNPGSKGNGYSEGSSPSLQADDLPIEDMMALLIAEHEAKNWHDFVDRQQNGDCAAIAGLLAQRFPQWLTHVVGNVETDAPYIARDDKHLSESRFIIHHWCRDPFGRIWDFAKNTLSGYVCFADIYDPAAEDPEIYHGAHQVTYK